jgi:hypothetical protein
VELCLPSDVLSVPLRAGQNERVRRSFVGLVLVVMAIGGGCSSQPQTSAAVAAAKRQVQIWLAADQADLRAVRAKCPGTNPISSCFVDSAAAKNLLAAEGLLTRAELALDRAEGHPASSVPGATRIYFPSAG